MESLVPLSEPIRRAVERSFPPDDRQAIHDMLTPVTNWGAEYVRAAVLALAYGDKDRLDQLATLAQADGRDVLIQLEYPEGTITPVELIRRYEMLGLAVPDVISRQIQASGPPQGIDAHQRVE